MIEKLEDKHIPMIKQFCKKCKALGWKNNQSIEAMRYNRVNRTGGAFLGLFDEELVGVAGYLPLPEIDSNAWRIFYRSATLPGKGPNKGLHRGTGPRGRMFIDKFIENLPNAELYVTTNLANDEYEHILRYHKSMEIESRMKDAYISKLCETSIDNAVQAVWKLDVQKYLDKTR